MHNSSHDYFVKAVQLYQDVVRRQIKLYGEETEKVLDTYETIGNIYATISDHANAHLALQRAYFICDELLGSDAARTLSLSQRQQEHHEMCNSL